MSLSALFLALFLILFAISAFGWIAISGTILAIVALVAGILILVEAAHPITIWHRQ